MLLAFITITTGRRVRKTNKFTSSEFKSCATPTFVCYVPNMMTPASHFEDLYLPYELISEQVSSSDDAADI
jgi:hypothetical protein